MPNLSTKRTKTSLLAIVLTLMFLVFSRLEPPIIEEDIGQPKSEALVTRVIDGDTVELKNGQRVRYIGMDTPERKECFYSEAKAANEKLVLNRKVRLEKDVSETDRYGRLLRYVYVGEVLVNRHLVREGYAKVATFPPDVDKQEILLAAEREARKNELGFWAETACANLPN